MNHGVHRKLHLDFYKPGENLYLPFWKPGLPREIKDRKCATTVGQTTVAEVTSLSKES